MREIVFDTETTGFDPVSGDRIVEIGCVVIVNGMPVKDETYHQYINPEREMPEGAFKIHGLSTEFLSGHPTFDEIYQDFLDFVGDDVLVAHNADFDMKFINWELENVGQRVLSNEVVDTLKIARAKFPGQANSLDALCRRFKIENGHRTLHGALLDSEILADVYLELKGGRQGGLELISEKKALRASNPKKERPHRNFPAKAEELENHDAFMKTVKNPLWDK